MKRTLRISLIDFTGLMLFGLAIFLITFSENLQQYMNIPSSVLHMNTIFLSILIEALPFVLIGVVIAGIIQIFITEDHIKRWIPKNTFLAAIMSCVVGALFPACECGIVPIVRRLIAKGVPIYAGIGFLLTGPLINPIVILSTYMAFGNDLKIALSRMIIGFLIALVIALIISFLFKTNQLKKGLTSANHIHSDDSNKKPITVRIGNVLMHAVDEFFDMGKYLIIGAVLAAFVQTYVSSESLVGIGNGDVASSTAVMMGLAYLLSLCSEADAFIAASFSNIFPTTAILAFLVYGPMIDLKNTLMMLSVFKTRFVVIFISIVTIVVFSTFILVQGLY
ncbi:permease [Aquibacillus koreensis]|uniref:Permease n=1 Tax=Aquibacillus koreensis TaxID=279446 RepID=A0A9X3WNP3_9BACI|nr:permease [Aquibacillus koreensis]MCT2536916.1 permease [Aquibacillus koreensis]MDC3421953.1 permease [Aquibacillus koreensis]